MKLAEQLRKLADEAENQKKTVLPKLAPINLQEAVDELQQVLGRVYTPIELRLEGSLGGTMKAKWSIWDGKNYQKGETLAEAVFAVHKSREPPKANVLAETEIALTPIRH
jgi:hypothetical protein